MSRTPEEALRLMKAAPELLKALELLVGRLPPEQHAARVYARTVIAWAQGGER